MNGANVDKSAEQAVPDARALGPIEAGVVVDIAQIDEPGTAGLKATAVHLARTLDEGAGLATAAVARELRTVLDSLKMMGPSSNDSDALADFISRLQTPVQ